MVTKDEKELVDPIAAGAEVAVEIVVVAVVVTVEIRV